MKNVFNIENAKLPDDTRRALTKAGNIENFSIQLYKTANFGEDGREEKGTLYTKLRKDKWKDLPERELKYVPDFRKIQFKKIKTRQSETAKSLYGESNCRELNLKTENRLIMGLGTASVYEVGITLHHIYGIPFIPATSIKGAVRSFIIQGKYEGKEWLAIGEKEFCDLFGCPAKLKYKEPKDGKKEWLSFYEKNKKNYNNIDGARIGKIIFLDAFPTTIPEIKEDIMTPHYGPYYTDGQAPADYHSPTPIPFLTVENTYFQFIVAGGDNTLVNTAEKYLLNTLTDFGIGAKTSVGYGYFEPPKIRKGNESEEKVIEKQIQKTPAKLVPQILQTGKLNPKKRYLMEGLVTKSGNPNFVDVYVTENKIEKNIRLDSCRSPLEIGTVVTIEVGITKKGIVQQASLKGIKR